MYWLTYVTNRMTAFIVSQTDYILFLNGLVFLFLAAVVYPTSGHMRADDGRAWKWLACFGLMYGIERWVNLLAFSLGNGYFLAGIGGIILAGAFLCLIEFGRATERARGVRVPPPMVSLLLLMVAVAWGLSEPTQMNLGISCALGLPGGLWVARTLWRKSYSSDRVSRPLVVAAVAMASFAVAVALSGVTNSMAILPSSSTASQPLIPIYAHLSQTILGAMIALIFLRVRHLEVAPINARFPNHLGTPLLLLLGVVLIAGLAMTEWQGRGCEREEASALLLAAKTANAAVDESRVATLAGVEADAKRPDYLYLKKQLMRLRKTTPDIRFIYLMRKVDQRIVMLVDSETPGSPDESPPGQIYVEAPKAVWTAFGTGVATVNAPYTDRWGTWVSAFVPYTDQEGRVIAVQGADISAALLKSMIARQRLEWIIITMLLAVLIVVFHVAQHREHEVQDGLKASEERFQQVAESVVDRIWEIDTTGRFTYVSPAVERILGYKPEEIVGHINFYDLFTPEQKESLRQLFLDAIARKERFLGLENANLHKDGHIVLLKTNAVPILDAHGTLLGYRGTDIDVTDLRRQEERQRQLEAQKVMLESIGAACHHIGQPATMIIMYLELMRRSATQPEVQAMIKTCHDAVNDLAKILEELRNVTQYRTEVYLAANPKAPHEKDELILKIRE